MYNTASCSDSLHITVATPGYRNWSYPNNTLPEPAIGITSGTVTSISGYSDLGGADSAVTLGLWETSPNQDMSKRANVIAGTLFHEIGHTIGLTHGGLYYDTPPNYVPNFDANCKPNYQSVMNYLFQLDGVGPNAAIAYSNQTLETLSRGALSSVEPTLSTTTTILRRSQPRPGIRPRRPARQPVPPRCIATVRRSTVIRAIAWTGTVDPISPAWSNWPEHYLR